MKSASLDKFLMVFPVWFSVSETRPRHSVPTQTTLNHSRHQFVSAEPATTDSAELAPVFSCRAACEGPRKTSFVTLERHRERKPGPLVQNLTRQSILDTCEPAAGVYLDQRPIFRGHGVLGLAQGALKLDLLCHRTMASESLLPLSRLRSDYYLAQPQLCWLKHPKRSARILSLKFRGSPSLSFFQSSAKSSFPPQSLSLLASKRAGLVKRCRAALLCRSVCRLPPLRMFSATPHVPQPQPPPSLLLPYGAPLSSFLRSGKNLSYHSQGKTPILLF